jgi:hypothetical protein
MFDVNDDAKVDTKGGFRRIELLTGPGRRRRWSAEEKTRIVEETLVPLKWRGAGRCVRSRYLPGGMRPVVMLRRYRARQRAR